MHQKFEIDPLAENLIFKKKKKNLLDITKMNRI